MTIHLIHQAINDYSPDTRNTWGHDTWTYGTPNEQALICEALGGMTLGYVGHMIMRALDHDSIRQRST